MGFVSWMVDFADSTLDAAAQSSFAALAGAMGGIVVVSSTLLIVLLLVSFALQTRSMDGRTAVLLLVRLVLINVFALNWVQFNTLASAVTDGLDQLGGAMVQAVGGGGPEGTAGFAQAFDILLDEFAEYLNAATEEMGWMGGAMITGVGALAMGIVGALAGGVLIFAKIMLALMIGLAPVMIAASIFEATKDYFHRWLSSLVGYAMYPLVIAGVMSTIIAMARNMMDRLGDPYDAGSIGALLPFFAMIFMAAGMIVAIPLIVRALSGNVVMANAPSLLGAAGGALAQGRAGAAGLFNTHGYQARYASGRASPAEMVGAGARRVLDTATASRGTGYAQASQVAQMLERNKRLDAIRAADGGKSSNSASPSKT